MAHQLPKSLRSISRGRITEGPETKRARKKVQGFVEQDDGKLHPQEERGQTLQLATSDQKPCVRARSPRLHECVREEDGDQGPRS